MAAAFVAAVVVASVAVPATSSTSHPSLSMPHPVQTQAFTPSSPDSFANTTAVVGHRDINDSSYVGGDEKSKPQQQGASVVRKPGEDLTFTPAQITALRKLLLPPPEGPSNATVGPASDGRSVSEEVRWRCFLEWVRGHSFKSRKGQKACDKEAGDQKALIESKNAKDCMPLLLLVVPALCNGTHNCLNLTESSVEELLHRYISWERKKKRQDEADDAVIYIVVVLAFYSFGIVFMIANFVRQEQRELEETKMYKQYVKVARDRWLTTRGNMANKLALQALNTFNAVPQKTDANKVTFV